MNKFHCLAWLPSLMAGYTYPVERLGTGQSLGNLNTYVTLDRNTDVINDAASVRRGFRESTNQRYYALAWTVEVRGATPSQTSFHPAYQETTFRLGSDAIRKKFFLPFEIGYSRAGHYLLERGSAAQVTRVRSRILFPPGSTIEQANFKGWKYVQVRLVGEGMGIVWGSASAESFHSNAAGEAVTEYTWAAGEAFGLSFVYSPGNDESASGTLLNAAFDRYEAGAPSTELHLFRLRHLLIESERAVQRYIDTARLFTPDAVINRASAWAKAAQLRLRQQYRWGEAFTNNPPSDVVVGRDSMWYLMGASYHAQAWSRKLLDFWFAHGIEPSGKFTEYMTASRDPMFSDDYGLNVNDNTPLLIIASHHYYSLTGDRDFLTRAYPSLLRAAGLIESQRYAGENNHYGLVWCTSAEKFVRGLCGWRNAISNYNLSGAVTEINSESYQAFRDLSELAAEAGDRANEARFQSAAEDLLQAINTYLRPQGRPEALYYLNINPAGKIIEQRTADEVYPVLYGVADDAASKAILNELFSDRFFAATPDGAGGFRTIGSDDKEYQPRSDPGNYGLLGGVWPNLGLWIARAAAFRQRPDLALKALRASAQITEMPDPRAYNVVPGEFPEYFNGDDLKQRGMPLSSFVPGIFVWSSLESFLGITPHPAGIEVNPVLPENWRWAAASRIPYRGAPLSLLAIAEGKVLYTTAAVHTTWRTVRVPAELQDRFRFEPPGEAFALVLPAAAGGLEALAASPAATELRVLDRRTGRELSRFAVPAGGVARQSLRY